MSLALEDFNLQFKNGIDSNKAIHSQLTKIIPKKWVERAEYFDCKTILAEHSSNTCKNKVTFWLKKKKIYHQYLSSQADPMRENWIWSYPHFNWKDTPFQFKTNDICFTAYFYEIWH